MPPKSCGELLIRVGRQLTVDPSHPERATEDALSRGREDGARSGAELFLDHRRLVALSGGLSFIVARQRAHERVVVWLGSDVVLAGRDRLVLLPVGAVGLGQLFVADRVAVGDLVLRIVDRRAARSRLVGVPELIEPAGARPHSEADEAHREDEREEDEHPLRLPPQPREEHLVLGDGVLVPGSRAHGSPALLGFLRGAWACFSACA